ncbi:MAG: lysophospholipid acyltransferase family protein [Acidimicrobiales bacterium]
MRLGARFPLGSPTWPTSVPRPAVEPKTGVHYDTSWARRYGARLARAVIVDDVLRPVSHLVARPQVQGLDRIEGLEGPAIFAANHQSHLDTSLVLSALPARLRHKAVVAAAADYFFTSRAQGTLSALALGAIPMERTRVGRRSADLAAELIADGWSLVIFPEGGRSPDGWGRPFRGGSAYLALRCGCPVVPIHLAGTGRLWKRGQKWPRPAARGHGVTITFGSPMTPNADEDSRRFSSRIEAAVAALADEQATDWWSARQRAAAGSTSAIAGPDAGSWRRAWALESGRSTTTRSWP